MREDLNKGEHVCPDCGADHWTLVIVNKNKCNCRKCGKEWNIQNLKKEIAPKVESE